MNKLEAKKTSELMKWIKHNIKESCAIEVKVGRGNKFYYKSGSFYKESLCLRQANLGTLAYKLPDTSTQGTPFDIFVLHKTSGYLIIFFGDVKKFYVIPIGIILEEINNRRVGLTEIQASQFAYQIGYLKGGVDCD